MATNDRFNDPTNQTPDQGNPNNSVNDVQFQLGNSAEPVSLVSDTSINDSQTLVYDNFNNTIEVQQLSGEKLVGIIDGDSVSFQSVPLTAFDGNLVDTNINAGDLTFGANSNVADNANLSGRIDAIRDNSTGSGFQLTHDVEEGAFFAMGDFNDSGAFVTWLPDVDHFEGDAVEFNSVQYLALNDVAADPNNDNPSVDTDNWIVATFGDETGFMFFSEDAGLVIGGVVTAGAVRGGQLNSTDLTDNGTDTGAYLDLNTGTILLGSDSNNEPHLRFDGEELNVAHSNVFASSYNTSNEIAYDSTNRNFNVNVASPAMAVIADMDGSFHAGTLDFTTDGNLFNNSNSLSVTTPIVDDNDVVTSTGQVAVTGDLNVLGAANDNQSFSWDFDASAGLFSVDASDSDANEFAKIQSTNIESNAFANTGNVEFTVDGTNQVVSANSSGDGKVYSGEGNVTVNNTNDVITANDTTYTAEGNVNISVNNVITATDNTTNIQAGGNVTTTALNATNVTVNTATTIAAGAATGIDLTNNNNAGSNYIGEGNVTVNNTNDVITANDADTTYTGEGLIDISNNFVITTNATEGGGGNKFISPVQAAANTVTSEIALVGPASPGFNFNNITHIVNGGDNGVFGFFSIRSEGGAPSTATQRVNVNINDTSNSYIWSTGSPTGNSITINAETGHELDATLPQTGNSGLANLRGEFFVEANHTVEFVGEYGIPNIIAPGTSPSLTTYTWEQPE